MQQAAERAGRSRHGLDRLPIWPGILVLLALCVVGAYLISAHRRVMPDGCVSCADPSASQFEPHLVLDRMNRPVVAFMAASDPSQGADHIGVTRLAGERAWEHPQRIGVGNKRAADPVLVASPTGSLHLFWLAFLLNTRSGGDPYEMQIMTSSRSPGAPSFGEAAAVTDAGRFVTYDKPWAATGPRGELLVVYRYGRPVEAGIGMSWSRDGAVFTHARVAHGPAFGGALPVVCTAGATVTVAWYEPLKGIVARSSDDLGTWQEDREVVVSTEGDRVAVEAPSCSADGHDVLIAYGTSAGRRAARESAWLDTVVVVRSADGGQSFNQRLVIRDSPGGMMHPQIAVDGRGDIHVVYYAGEHAGAHDGQIQHRVIRAVDQQASAPSVLRQPIRLVADRTRQGWLGDYLALATGPGGLVVAAVDNAGGPSRVVLLNLPGAP